jgi:hypothetical protein
MSATARQFDIPQEDLDNDGGGGGAYAEIEVPGDYEVTLVDVEDYDKRSEGKSFGWVWTYEAETPSGKTVPFRTWTAFSPAARWKLIEVLEAHGVDIEAGINSVDPNDFIGDVVGATIDFPRDKEEVPTSDFRELRSLFALAAAPVAEEPTLF